MTLRLLSTTPWLKGTRPFYSSCVLKKNPYTNTLLLPKTEFPLRADAVNREHLFRDRCTKDLYPWQVMTTAEIKVHSMLSLFSISLFTVRK